MKEGSEYIRKGAKEQAGAMPRETGGVWGPRLCSQQREE